MTTIEVRPHREGWPAIEDIPAERRVRRRDELEAVGFLLGILGILLVLAVTVGTAPPI